MTIKTVKYYFIILIIFCGCHKDDSLTSEEIAMIDSITGSYIYPIERSEQKLFEVGWDKYYDTCIIPNRVLEHLTDLGLIESCLNYPPFFNLFYFDSYQDGFDRILRESNVFNELYSRNGIGRELISKYKSTEVDSFVLSNILKGNYTIQYLEIILSQNQILNNTTSLEKYELIQEIIRKNEYRTTVLNEEIFSSVLSALILGRTLKRLNYQSFIMVLNQNPGLNSFLEKGPYYDTTSTSMIISFSRKYFKNK